MKEMTKQEKLTHVYDLLFQSTTRLKGIEKTIDVLIDAYDIDEMILLISGKDGNRNAKVIPMFNRNESTNIKGNAFVNMIHKSHHLRKSKLNFLEASLHVLGMQSMRNMSLIIVQCNQCVR